MKSAEERRKSMIEREIAREHKLQADINAYCDVVLEEKMNEAELKNKHEVIISIDELLEEFDGTNKSIDMFFKTVERYGYNIRNAQTNSKDYSIEW